MHNLAALKPGDTVELIAPASRFTDALLTKIKDVLTSWQLHCIVDPGIFGDDLLCANDDASRLRLLKQALLRPETKAVICARGGYGCMRLIPELRAMTPPATSKLWMGMSDITALNLFLMQQWQWPVIHGALALDKFSDESIATMRSALFGDWSPIRLQGLPLNALAEKNTVIESTITGGNLSLLQTSIGTIWQLDSRHKIIFIEEIAERGYRVDRMLEHLHQAGLFQQADAILFGDFIDGKEPDGSSLEQPVLERFAKTCPIPVVQIKGLGHGRTSFPLPLGVPVSLTLGKNISISLTHTEQGKRKVAT